MDVVFGWDQRLDDAFDADGNQDSHERSASADQESLEEELVENFVSAGSDGFSQADFAGALSHGYEHDVHNAHAANHHCDATEYHKNGR